MFTSCQLMDELKKVQKKSEPTQVCRLQTGIGQSEQALGVVSTRLGSAEIGQSIRVAVALSFSNVLVGLKVKGDPNGNLTLKVMGDSGGAPDGHAIDSASFPIRQIRKGAARFVEFKLSRTHTLTPGKTYWITLDAAYSPNNEHLVFWSANDRNSYPDGRALYRVYSTGRWTNVKVSPKRDLALKLGCVKREN